MRNDGCLHRALLVGLLAAFGASNGASIGCLPPPLTVAIVSPATDERVEAVPFELTVPLPPLMPQPFYVLWNVANGTAPYQVQLSVAYEGPTDSGRFKPISGPLTQDAAGDNVFVWFVPNRPSQQAKLRVEVVDNAGAGAFKDVVFRLETAPGVPTTATLRDFDMPGTQPHHHGNDIEEPLGSNPRCSDCHDQSTPQSAETEAAIPGVEPINIFRNWRGSMMAMASIDPLFEACLEIANQDVPESGDLCLRCHTPKAWLNGRSTPTDGSIAEPAGVASFDKDKTGVSCDFCHRLVDPLDGIPPLDRAILDRVALVDDVPPVYGNGMYVIDPQAPTLPDTFNPIPARVDDTLRRRGPFTVLDAVQQRHRMLTSIFFQRSGLCGTCHDVSNPALSGSGGVYALNASNTRATNFSASALMPIERTYSEWLASSYPGGVRHDGFDPIKNVASCQDCHMRDSVVGANACNRANTTTRQDMPYHDMTGGNTFIPAVLRAEHFASSTSMASALSDTIIRARYTLENAATIELQELAGEPPQLRVRVVNETGHKLPTGYPEGRRMWLNVRFLDAQDRLLSESNPYNAATAHLDHDRPEDKIFEAELKTTGGQPFHFVLANTIAKDNRIPPRGFTNAAFAAFGGTPIGDDGQPVDENGDPIFADGQYWDDTGYAVPPCAAKAVVALYYQTASREYVEFLRDENRHPNHGKGQVLYDFWKRNGKSKPEFIGRGEGRCSEIASGNPTGATCSPAVGCGGGKVCRGGYGIQTIQLARNAPDPSQPPVLCRAVSRKTHGGFQDFDVQLPRESEPRVGGPTLVIASFDQDLAANPGAVSVAQGTAQVDSWGVSGKDVTVDISGVADEQCLTLRFEGFQQRAAPNLVMAPHDLPVVALLGDTTSPGDGSVATHRDVEEAQEFSGLLVDSHLFRYDVNLTGNISAADIAQSAAQVGNTASCP